jgi:hypothetical protein
VPLVGWAASFEESSHRILLPDLFGNGGWAAQTCRLKRLGLLRACLAGLWSVVGIRVLETPYRVLETPSEFRSPWGLVMLDHINKSSAMLPPASFVGMGDNAGNLVGVPEYHYTQVRIGGGTALGSLCSKRSHTSHGLSGNYIKP